MKPRYKLLDQWVAQAIIDKPEIIKGGEAEPIEIYIALRDIFLDDVQRSLKGIAKAVLALEKDKP